VTGQDSTTRCRVRLDIEGLVAVHAVRSVWTALTAVPGIVTAEVSMSGAVLEMERAPDRAELDAALEPAGARIVAMHIEARRVLPLA
jgi:hypothetical protein